MMLSSLSILLVFKARKKAFVIPDNFTNRSEYGRSESHNETVKACDQPEAWQVRGVTAHVAAQWRELGAWVN